VPDLGILGGTFNPPHVAHLVMAQEALDQLGLQRVALMPVSVPPHKEAADDPGPRVRVELCRLAVAGDERLEVSLLEVDRGSRSYTVDTLRELHDRHPDDALTFILGGDMACSLPTWREPEAILDLARLAVAERDGLGREEVLARLDPLGRSDRVAFFDMPRIDVASSTIRHRVATGHPIRYLVPDAVAQAVEARGLYRRPAGRPAA
jgi:nicotinate-nucleotide adenylyltransferase